MQSNLHISILEFTYLKQNPQCRNVSPKMCHWVAAMPSTGLDFQDAFTSEIWTHFTFQIDHYSMAKKTNDANQYSQISPILLQVGRIGCVD